MKHTTIVVVAVGLGLLLSEPLAALEPLRTTVNDSRATYRGVLTVMKSDVSPPLRLMPVLATQPEEEHDAGEERSWPDGVPGPQDTDPLVQSSVGGGSMPSPIWSFNGPANISKTSPPDPVGDVGFNYYVAMSNLSFAIYNKMGGLVFGPAANKTLWAGFGGACESENAGDPIVLHDQFADRWILSQFTSAGPNYFNCVAVSTGSDPTGSYQRYAISTGTNFPDYPKYAVWRDAYYFSAREFSGNTFAGVGAYALNRAQILAGSAAPQVISFLVAPGATPYNVGDGLLPCDLDGTTLPPAGTPNFFAGSMDNGGPYGAPQDALTLWKFHVDFATPANSTFTLASTIPIAAFDTNFPCGPTGRQCISQPGTLNKLDVLSYRQRPLYRLAYRNFGTHESLVANQSVEASPGIAGIRWWEIRSPNSSASLFQQGTYAPGVTDGISRWMGSIAMDNAGNMGLGFSASSSTVFPSVRYTGRLASDTAGTMAQGEVSIIAGTGSQTDAERWGDYSSMNIDPADDCTFWYVNTWVPVTSDYGWRLRIGAFRFPSCVPAPMDFTIFKDGFEPGDIIFHDGFESNGMRSASR
jgi:hypothetical protein